MKLVNKTKRKIISENVIPREGFLDKMIGLLLHKKKNVYIYDYLKFKKFRKSDVMLFKVRGRNAIHTWFMSFPIGVVFLDRDGIIIERVLMKPFETYKPKHKCESFVELDGSWINKINVGDKLEIK